MISNQRQLYSVIDNILLDKGFVRKRDTWYLFTDECICFFALPKSQYGGSYSGVSGCIFRALYTQSLNYPPYYHNHLKFAIQDLTGNHDHKSVFNLEDQSFVNDERELKIYDIMTTYVLPFISDLTSSYKIKQSLKKYPLLKHSTHMVLREYLKKIK